MDDPSSMFEKEDYVQTSRQISLIRTILVTIFILFFVGSHGHAHSYGFLNKAIREYVQNPTPATRAQLTKERHKAMMLDFGILAIPAGLMGYILVRCLTHKKKSMSDGAF